MKILTAITYYRPHMSGLTIYAERLAKALVAQGHEVTLLTSQYEPDLPLQEEMAGVKIVRVPVLLRISKGVIMPAFGRVARKLIKEHDVVHLHLPQFDGPRVAIRGWFEKKPVVITYHCDLQMPKGVFNWFANQGVIMMNLLTGIFSDRIITYTRDYAEHSNFVKRFMRKLEVIDPPVVLPQVTKDAVDKFRITHNPNQNHPIIGMASRFATEKGVEVLLNALEWILEKHPRTQVWFAGPYQNIMGERKYFDRLKPLIDFYRREGHWKFFGLLSPQEMAVFYPNLDILTIPSLNSTEAFGLIQIEAMMSGIQCIASNLPGVRQPVMRHAMGEIIPIGDSKALAQAVDRIMETKNLKTDNWKTIGLRYKPASVANSYVNLFDELINEKK